MTQFTFQAGPGVADNDLGFRSRPASTTWEKIPIRDVNECFVWIWFRPANVPHGLVVRIPDEAFHDPPDEPILTMRTILETAGIELESVSACWMHGVPFEGMNGTSPLFDKAVKAPAAGIDPNIVVWTIASDAPHHDTPEHVAAPPEAAPADPDLVLDRIEAHWKTSLQLDQQLAIVRKQFVEVLARINALNRELSPEETAYGDRQDKREWQDARRWLRDATMRLSRYLKEYDVGWTSAAGKRNWFEQMYQHVVLPRQHIEGIELIERYFEGYRKTVQTLLIQMNNTYSYALNDGERRAQQILNRIAVKVRAARAKRGSP